MKPYFITAICTPLQLDGSLHQDGIRRHLNDQAQAGIDGILVGGTMGQMQMLTDTTFRQLVTLCVEECAGRFEIFVGVGDTSFDRTSERLRFLNAYRIDGAVVLTPFFNKFGQAELIEYFRALADCSKAPLYLYDLPARVQCKLELDTIGVLAEHPNIRGIKSSDELAFTRRLYDKFGDRFRVIVASPHLIDMCLQYGMHEQLDGVFALAPHWVTALGRAASAGDWKTAASHQADLSALVDVVRKYGPAASATILNARGIPGTVPRPHAILSSEIVERIWAEPVVRRLTG